ncbi:MAG: HAD hydrolase family protein [Lachnospiraceae bacterium]|nr:HAD hydrolase family protein [Lachnospiraceae bacterium]
MYPNWKNIALIVSDFDGVMTDNRVLVDEVGKESVFVSRADGQAVHILRSMGIDLVIISTEANGVVGKRAEKLRVNCIQSVLNKAECLQQYCKERDIPLCNVAYIGNDINDFDAMQLVGVKIVPKDAYEEVKCIADYVTDTRGGYGVIREVAELFRKYKE